MLFANCSVGDGDAAFAVGCHARHVDDLQMAFILGYALIQIRTKGFGARPSSAAMRPPTLSKRPAFREPQQSDRRRIGREQEPAACLLFSSS